MTNIPRSLNTNKIRKTIRDLINFDDARSYDALDDMHKDHLVSLGLAAMDYDKEIVLQSTVNQLLARFLDSGDRLDERDLTNAIKQEAHEAFAQYYNAMFEDELADIEAEEKFQRGKRKVIDAVNGETRWL